MEVCHLAFLTVHSALLKQISEGLIFCCWCSSLGAMITERRQCHERWRMPGTHMRSLPGSDSRGHATVAKWVVWDALGLYLQNWSFVVLVEESLSRHKGRGWITKFEIPFRSWQKFQGAVTTKPCTDRPSWKTAGLWAAEIAITVTKKTSRRCRDIIGINTSWRAIQELPTESTQLPLGTRWRPGSCVHRVTYFSCKMVGFGADITSDAAFDLVHSDKWLAHRQWNHYVGIWSLINLLHKSPGFRIFGSNRNSQKSWSFEREPKGDLRSMHWDAWLSGELR